MHLRQARSTGPLLRRVRDGREFLTLRPDLVFAQDADACLVADAKWKKLNHKKLSLGINRGDAYQMMAYMERLSLGSSVLFFPQAQRSSVPIMAHSFNSLPAYKKIVVIEISVEGMLNRNKTHQQKIDAELRTLLTNMDIRDPSQD